MTVVGIARESACADDQSALLGDRKTRLHAELVRLPGFASVDALDLGRVQLALVLWALPTDLPRPREPRLQCCLMRFSGRSDLEFDGAQPSTKDRALTYQDPAKPLVLRRMRVAAGASVQSLAFALVGLLERESRALCQLNELCSRHLQQPAVGWIRDRLLLHCRINDHALEFVRREHLHVCGDGDRHSQQFHDAGFAKRLENPHQVRRIAKQVRLEILLAAEVLEVDILSPVLADRFVRQVVRVLQVQQTGAIKRIGRRGLPAVLMPAPAGFSAEQNRSMPPWPGPRGRDARTTAPATPRSASTASESRAPQASDANRSSRQGGFG
ncbi:hypothetical protein J2785_007392 [Burkholderia ambifaria]|nr:hypothetical protein [Burkholderia ambifaria]